MKSGTKTRVILVTDGDCIAQKAVETAVKSIGGRCISASAGNPTPLSGKKIVELIKQAEADPVVVMFDDKGSSGKGRGETALEFVARHPDLEVMGVLAVASNTGWAGGASIDCAVTAEQQVIEGRVDKDGRAVSKEKYVLGDTVDVLDALKGEKIPFVVGVGDLGKMNGRDDPARGAEITTKALRTIVEHWEHRQKRG